MNTLQKVGYTAAGLAFTAGQTFAADMFGSEKIDRLKTGANTETLDKVIINWITWAMSFLALIAVIYFIYGGFKILTAGGDDDSVKQGKNIITRAIIGIIVIALSWSAVTLVISFVLGNATR